MQLAPTRKQILAIALPIMAGNFFHTLISFTDTVFMGRVGQAELAACGYATLYYMLLGMVGYSLALSGQIIIARRAGQNDRRAIGLVFDNLTYLLLGIGVITLVGLLVGSGPLLNLLLPDPAVREAALTYLQWRSPGIPAIFLVFAGGALVTGLGRTRILIWATGGMAVINIALNYPLVFGYLGFEPMGIKGAAIASVVSEWSSLAFMVGHLVLKRYGKVFLLLRSGRPKWSYIKRIGNLGLPIVGQSLVGAVSWLILFTLIARHLGSAALAFSNILKIVYTLLAIPTWGFAGAINTMVSNLVGQKRSRYIPILVQRTVLFSAGVMVVMLTMMLLFPTTIFQLFTDDLSLLETYRPSLLAVSGSLFLLAGGNIYFRVVTGLGAAGYALKTEVVSVAIYLVFAYSVTAIWEAPLWVAWCTEVLYWVILGGLSAWYVWSGRWRDINI